MRKDTKDGWVEAWLSEPRLRVYLDGSGGDLALALNLYEWNSRICAALMHDIGHLEVGLRNAYDRALSEGLEYSNRWMFFGNDLFSQKRKPDRGGVKGQRRARRLDAAMRASLRTAIRIAGGEEANPGHVVANLTLGFWWRLTSGAFDVSIWRPALHTVFPAGTRRAYIHEKVGHIHQARNRSAHHEPLFKREPERIAGSVIEICGMFSPDLASYIESHSSMPDVMAKRPARLIGSVEL